MRRRTFSWMGSRLLSVSLAFAALLADGIGAHRLGYWLVLLAVPAAATAAFVGCADVLDGRRAWLRGVSASLALAFLVLACAVREGASQGRGVPALAISAVLGAVILYGLPALAWVLQPVVSRRHVRAPAARIRTQP
jgi:hypothetical protein